MNKRINKLIHVSCILALISTQFLSIPTYAASSDILFSNSTDPFVIDMKQKFIDEQKQKIINEMNAFNVSSQDIEDIPMEEFDFDEDEEEGTEEQIVEKKATSYFRTFVSNLLTQAENNTTIQSWLAQHINKLDIERIQKDLDQNNILLDDISNNVALKDSLYQNKIITLQLTRRQLESKQEEMQKVSDLLDKSIEWLILTEEELKVNTNDLEKNKTNYGTQLKSLYLLQIDIWNHDGEIDDIKLMSKSDSMAVSLAQQHISGAMQETLSTLLDKIDTKEKEIINIQEKLEEKKLEFSKQSEELKKQKTRYEEQSNSYKTQLEEIQKWLEALKSELNIVQEKSTSLEELIEIQDSKEAKKWINHSWLFDFPVQWDITRLTAFFVDQWYINHFWFAHYAVDIPRPQWSPTLAPAPGYVYKVFEQDTSALNWFIVLHEDGFATVYLHMLDIDVEPGTYVNTWDKLGTSWWAPGTRWAWFHTTWPHLHREVWKDSDIVDPLLYTNLSRVTNPAILQNKYKNKREIDNTVLEVKKDEEVIIKNKSLKDEE